MLYECYAIDNTVLWNYPLCVDETLSHLGVLELCLKPPSKLRSQEVKRGQADESDGLGP